MDDFRLKVFPCGGPHVEFHAGRGAVRHLPAGREQADRPSRGAVRRAALRAARQPPRADRRGPYDARLHRAARRRLPASAAAHEPLHRYGRGRTAARRQHDRRPIPASGAPRPLHEPLSRRAGFAPVGQQRPDRDGARGARDRSGRRREGRAPAGVALCRLHARRTGPDRPPRRALCRRRVVVARGAAHGAARPARGRDPVRWR